MRDSFLLLMFLAFAALGLSAPFVAALGYIWIDFFSPQRLGWGLMKEMPLSLAMGGWALLLYLLFDRRDPPRISGTWLLMAAFGVWVTLTTTWAVVPEPAWIKWDRAVKMIGFALLVPFLFRTLVQIEAMLLTLVFSIAGTILAFSSKALLSGSGYGRRLGLFPEDMLLGEGATLAATGVAAIPIALAFARGSRLLPWPWLSAGLGYGYAAAAAITAVATYTRTGVVALLTLTIILWWSARRKLLFGLLIVAGVMVSLPLSSDLWIKRISTIIEYNSEASALGRIGVWKWTLRYVGENPLGGGFDAYRINRAVVPVEGEPGQVLEIRSKAFHSNYFEVLGEHGVPGLALYLAILTGMFLNLKITDIAENRIMRLRRGIRDSAIVYLACAAFVGMAFQPYLYYMVGASIALCNVRNKSSPVYSGSTAPLRSA